MPSSSLDGFLRGWEEMYAMSSDLGRSRITSRVDERQEGFISAGCEAICSA